MMTEQEASDVLAYSKGTPLWNEFATYHRNKYGVHVDGRQVGIKEAIRAVDRWRGYHDAALNANLKLRDEQNELISKIKSSIDQLPKVVIDGTGNKICII